MGEQTPGTGVGSTWGPAVFKSLIMAVAAGVLYLLFELQAWAAVVAGIALVMLVTGLVVPAAYRAIDSAVLKGARAFGAVLTWVLLVPFFFFCFVPGRVLLWIMGRDPLHRQIDPDRPSYWSPYRNVTDERRYKRQY